jgi:hypothetical protein
MGLLDQITALNGAERDAQHRAIIDAIVQRDQSTAIRYQIVGDKIAEFATRYGCACTELSVAQPGRHFLIDEFVLVIQEEVLLNPASALSTNPNDVLWQHFAYLAALDFLGHVRRFKIGTLKMLDIEGLRTVYNRNVGYEFSHHAVTTVLFQA